MKERIIIRMGAGKWLAAVRNGDTITVFALNKMDRKAQHVFRRELVKAFRIAGEQI